MERQALPRHSSTKHVVSVLIGVYECVVQEWRLKLIIFQHWFRWWLGADQVTSHCLNQWWLVHRRIHASLGHNELINEGLFVNSLWPSDTIWQHRSGSTLAQIMACCLMAPSHYLKQCWIINSKVHWHSSILRSISPELLEPSLTKISLKVTYLKFN